MDDLVPTRPPQPPRFRLASLAALILTLLSGCGAPRVAACPAALAGHDVVYVLARGWHTQIGLPAAELQGGLAVFRRIYPGAGSVMFGYGKRSFMAAPPDDISEYALGPVPGPALIETVGLSGSPPDSYGAEGLIALALPPGGAARLSAFVANEIARDGRGEPLPVGPGPFAGALFYAARSGYTLFHTCNSWVAEALAAAGLPVDADFAVLSGQTMARAAAAAREQCPPAPRHS